MTTYRRCYIAPGAAGCSMCSHGIDSHLYPSGVCTECLAAELDRLSLSEEVQDRIDQLAHALVFVVQRLERIEHHVAIRGTDASWLSERPVP
jgi:hypothetical protein